MRRERKKGPGRSADRRVLAVAVYVSEHPSEPMNLTIAAKMAGTSRTYFSRLFRRVTGVRFSEWLARSRIDFAKEALRRCDDPITEIAFLSGYSTLGTFERAFKRLEGVPPSEYRKRISDPLRGASDGANLAIGEETLEPAPPAGDFQAPS